MTDPIAGRLGSLIMTAWVSETRGGDQAVVLLSTPDRRAETTMPPIAAMLGVPTSALDPEITLVVRADGWLRLTLPGGVHVERPGGRDVNAVAVQRSVAGLIVGFLPMPAGRDVDVYTEQLFTSGAYAAGEIPVVLER